MIPHFDKVVEVRPYNLIQYSTKGHVFLFAYFDFQVNEVLQRIARMAATVDCVITWHDAAVLSQEIRTNAQLFQAK